MSAKPTQEEQIELAGRVYGRRHDISYRAGLVMQALGAGISAVLYPLDNPLYTAGIMLFETGVLLSAAYLLVRISSIRIFILISVVAGMLLQIIGSLFAPEQYAGTVMLAGIGLVCAGAGGMAGKEAYCFGYREGWMLILAGFPIMVLANLLGKENRILNALGFSVLFLLLLSLAGKKLKQPLLTACSPTDACNKPTAKQ